LALRNFFAPLTGISPVRQYFQNSLFRQGFDEKHVINMGIPVVVFVVAGAPVSANISIPLSCKHY
jgi:hypothetical protein